jgi:hypothetical protein
MIDTNQIKSWSRVRGLPWPVMLEASNNIKGQSLSEKTNSVSGVTGALVKTIYMHRPGSVRLTFDWWGQYLCGFRLLLNDTLLFNRLASSDGDWAENTWHTVVYDLNVLATDSINFRLTVFDTGQISKLRNVYIAYDSIKKKDQSKIIL